MHKKEAMFKEKQYFKNANYRLKLKLKNQQVDQLKNVFKEQRVTRAKYMQQISPLYKIEKQIKINALKRKMLNEE